MAFEAAARTRIRLRHGLVARIMVLRALTTELSRLGHAAHTVDLPSVGDGPERLGGLAEDGAAVSRAAAALAGQVVVVGHSYGGVAVSEARFGANVRRLIYLAAFMPDARRTYVSYLPPGPLPPYVGLRADGTFAVPPGQARAAFYRVLCVRTSSGVNGLATIRTAARCSCARTALVC